MRTITIIISLLTIFVFLPSSANANKALYNGRTIVFYHSAHGIQVEHYAKSGRLQLWYPGNRRPVGGRWKVKNGSVVCFRYGGNTYNPVTRQRGGKWECQPIKRNRRNMKYACHGDQFGLSSGKIPYVLKRRKFGLIRLKSKCGGKV